MRARMRSTSTTPGTDRIAASAFSGNTLRRAVEQGFHGRARHLQAQEADHHGYRDRGRRIAPPEAESCESEAGDDGEGAEHVGGEMQRIGGQRLAARLARGTVQGARAPEIHGDVDDEHDKGIAEMVGGGVPSRRRP